MCTSVCAVDRRVLQLIMHPRLEFHFDKSTISNWQRNAITTRSVDRVLNAKRSDLNQRLQRYQLKSIRNLDRGKNSRGPLSANRMEVLEVTLIALAVAILMGTLVAVGFVAFARSRLKYFINRPLSARVNSLSDV